MKVVKNILLGLFICVLGVFAFSAIKVNMVREKNDNYKAEIKKITNDNNSAVENNKTKEEELKQIKDEAKDKIEEKEIWEKAEEKLNKALS